MQVQIQALLVAGGGGTGGVTAGPHVEVAKPAIFSGEAGKVGCYDSRLKVFKSKNNSCIGVTQENSIEFLVQSSLPYILVPMVCANYCAPYPKRP